MSEPELKQKKEEVIEDLRIHRDNCSDEIASEILDGSVYRTVKYKVRRNWWLGVIGGLCALRSTHSVPPDLEQEVDDFIEHYTSENFHRQPLTTEDDIKRANLLITKIVGDKQD